MFTTGNAPRNLSALFGLMLRSAKPFADYCDDWQEGDASDEWITAGLGVSPSGAADWSSCPSFGGDEPTDTTGVWSWDENDMIVGTCVDDIRVVNRTDPDAE